MLSVKVLALAALAMSVGCERIGDRDASGGDAVTPGASDTPLRAGSPPRGRLRGRPRLRRGQSLRRRRWGGRVVS